MSEHPHGTVQRYWSGCRDEPCRAANTAYVAEKRRAKREAENPFPNALVWAIARPSKLTAHYNTLGSVRKAVHGMARAMGGVVTETLVIDYWDDSLNDWKTAWIIPEGTRAEDLRQPWRKQ